MRCKIEWRAETKEKPTFDPTRISVQKLDAETGKASAQSVASLIGAEFTLKYYSGNSASGNPAKTWVITTDSSGLAILGAKWLKKGSDALYTSQSGTAILPLGTVTIQETKAPTGYKLNNKVTTLHIVDHDGKAEIQMDGSTSYLQEYTVKIDEEIIRGDINFTKIDGRNNDKFDNIPFVLTNNDTGESHLLITDENGEFDSKLGRDKANGLDEAKMYLRMNADNEVELSDEGMLKIVNQNLSTGNANTGVWFGDGDVKSSGGALPYGSYSLVEIRCTKNAGLTLISKDFSVNEKSRNFYFGKQIDSDNPGSIRGKKTDPDGKDLSGAVIGLFAADAKEFTLETANMTAISGADGSFRFDEVSSGDYIVHEIEAPAGYILSDKSYPVTVEPKSETVINENLVNTPTKVTVEKTDADGKPLSGAKLQIIARLNVKVNNGTVVEEWTTDGTAQTISGKLEVGGYYELTEVTPPDGYVKASSVMFTIGADGKTYDTDGNPMDLKLVDTPTVVTVTKHNEDEELLAGAKMQILDSKGEVVDEWITGTEAHVITAKLAVGGTYTLHEAEAPAGYYPEDDMPFTVPESGSITVDMIDYATTSVIHKRDDQNRPVSGAVLQILAPDSKVVDEWTTDGTAHVVSGLLNPNTTYTLHEVSAPEGYFPAEDKTFQVNDKGELLTPILMIDVKYGSLLVGKMSDIQQQPDSGDVIWLAGAKLQILDQDGNVLDEWTSESSSQHVIEAILHPGETYVLHEVAAPDGYCTAADIEFTLDEKGQFAKSDSYESGQRWIRMYDLATKVEIQKLDEDGKALAGASLQLLDKNGKVVDSWVSDENVHQIYGRLLAGETYTLHEVAAPAGYCVAADKTFTVGTDGKVQNIELIDLSTKVSITKEDENGKALAGAQLELYDSNNVLVESWTSDGKAHEIQAKLTAGAAYTLHEAAAPAGYVVAKDMKFTVNADGSVTDVVMVDIATKVEITKTDITGEKELFGAKLEVRDLSGNVLDSWISTEKAHVITAKLSAGQTYVLHEESAPNGYVVANDVEFTVNTDATITKVEIKDDTTKVEFHKLTEDGKPLSGAKLQILAKDGTVVDEWTSDGTAHVLTAKLIAGAAYTLHEVSAPAGYCVAADKPFTVGTDGKLQSVSMTDLSTKVSLTKYEITGKKELPGAKLELYAAEKDKDGKLVQTGKVIDAWTSTEKAHEIVGELIAGASYILHETAAPAGYVIASDVSFTVNADGSVTPVVMKDDTTKVEIHKLTEDGKPLSGAKLQILDSKGKVVDEWTSDGTAHVLTAKLTAGQTYTLHEVSAPAGYCVTADQTFKVGTDGKLQSISITDLATEVDVDKVDPEGKPLSGAKLQILDSKGKVVDEWTSDGKTHAITAKLTAGATYTLRETAAPEGYYQAKDITFTVNANGTPNEVTLYNAQTKVSVSKYDITGEKEISGAKLEIRDKDSNVLDSWTSSGKAHEIVGVLVAGQTYILHETVPADGYVVASDVEFTVNADGSITEVKMYDDTTKVEISKLTEDKKPLSGAKLQIIAKDGTVVDEWTSDGTVHVLTAKLIAGAEYILHEVSAPAGYVVSPDQTFTVNTDGSVTSVSMTDIATEVDVDKVDPEGKPLKGAKLQILDSKGKVVDEWTSDGTVHVLRAKLTAGQTYTLREVASPAGYYVSKDSTFTVNLDGTPNEITLYNVRTKAAITKYDITGENPLAGASLQVLDQDGNVIDEWVSTAEAHLIEGVLISGETYILRETAAPAGYVVSDDVQFTVNPDGTITTVEMKDDTTKVSITKQDITGEKELAGAALEVRDADGNVIDSWVSDGTAHVITGILAAGETYTLHEVSAPDGYVVAKDAEFTVDASGKVTSVTMLDDTTKVSITKTNITGDAEIPGASMEVRDAQGNVIDAWISDGTAHPIIGVLAVGQTYTLHEVAAPAGYVVASDIEFTVNADGSVTEVSMKDDTTKVQLSKQAITGSAELPGASLELYDANGNVVDAWISGSTPHDIEGVLTAGAEYTLHEVSAPNGYVVASDVKFTVGLDGAVDQVTMVDDTTKVEISKTDITTGELLSGATLQIIASDNTVVEEWVSTAEPHMIEAVLTAGETYTLHETAAPNGYVISEDVSFTVNLDGSVTPVKMYDDVTKVRITKYDITGETELPGASLEVRDADGNVVDAWISTDSAHEINGVLIAGAEYTLHEISAPNGYVTATDVKFNVNADGSVTMVSMKDYPTVVHITKKDITTGEELPGAYLELYDKDHNLIDSWVSGTEAHIIEAVLIAGEKYTLIETSAPNGYVISEQIEFTVNLDETITHVDMFDDTTKVSLSKKSITGDDELPGASMQLLDKDGNIVDEWISGTEPHRIEGILIAGETYTLHEESAPNGYVVASDMEFTVSTDGKVDVITMTDDTTKVEISKTDITGERPVEGAKLQIIDKDGNIVHEWISGKDVNYLEADLTAGETYVLHEESAPDGYVVSEDVEFTVNADGTIHPVQMKDATTKVSITKYDITTGEELPGATLQILDKDGNVIDEWVSTAEAHLIEGVLIAGETYTLREITAPDGWTVTEDVNFTVDTDGSVTHVEMFDSPTNVSIRKLGADGKDLSGAKMQILDKDGNVIEEWTTDGKAHVLTAKLVAGETYTLHEVSAPDGYTVAKDKRFTVGEEDAVTEVVMVDEKVPVATPTPSTTSAPKTADAMPVMAIGTGLLASLILMLFFRKKKRSKK